MRNIALVIAYNGKKFYGWQKQKGFISVQETIETSLKKITGEDVNLIGVSRTDAGVNALNQVANFLTNSKIPIDNFAKAIQSNLPSSIVIKKATEVVENFNARLNAKKKTYMYIVDNSKLPNPILIDKVFFYPYNLDFDKILNAKEEFIGTKDFKALANVSNQPSKCSDVQCISKNTVRTIYDIKIEKKGTFIIFYATADGFLYRMIRNLVGTLLDAGTGKLSLEQIRYGLEKKDRKLLGFCAPPHALYLYTIEY